MRKMKSRVLAVLMAAGMIFTAQGMTVLAGTTGIGAAKTEYRYPTSGQLQCIFQKSGLEQSGSR